jgi:hypothetical protein
VCSKPSFSPDFTLASNAAGLSIPYELYSQALPQGWRLTPGALVSGAVITVVAIPIFLAGALPLLYGQMSYPRLFRWYDPILRLSMVFTWSAWILILTAVRCLLPLKLSYFGAHDSENTHRDWRSRPRSRLTLAYSTWQ